AFFGGLGAWGEEDVHTRVGVAVVVGVVVGVFAVPPVVGVGVEVGVLPVVQEVIVHGGPFCVPFCGVWLAGEGGWAARRLVGLGLVCGWLGVRRRGRARAGCGSVGRRPAGRWPRRSRRRCGGSRRSGRSGRRGR